MCLFLTIFLPVNSFAFHLPDSSLYDTNRVKVRYFQLHYKDQFRKEDTLNPSLDRFQVYNPADKFKVFNHLGNLGTASQQLIFTFPQEKPGFQDGRNTFSLFEFHPDSTIYFDTRTPYTELFYVNGSGNENLFYVQHSQNIRKNINAGLKYQRLYSDGFYLNQRVNNGNFTVHGSLRSKYDRYLLFFNAIWNDISVQENGGIRSDSLFENTSEHNKKTIPVNLIAAENRHWSRSVFIKQFYHLGKKTCSDTVMNDTTTLKMCNVKPRQRLSHSFYFEEKTNVYEDKSPDSLFYSTLPSFTLFPRDTIFNSKMENELAWAMVPEYFRKKESRKGIAATLKARHQFIRYYQQGWDTVMQNIIAGGEVIINEETNTVSRITADYVLSGVNKNDFRGNAQVSHRRGNSITAVFFGYVLKNPEWITIRNLSNYFYWENNFDKISHLQGSLSYHYLPWRISFEVNIHRITGYIYFGKNAKPIQDGNDQFVKQVRLTKNFHFRKWRMINEITWQHNLDKNIIRLPEWVGLHSLYYESVLFQKALLMQAGIDIFYDSHYFADSYMPATGIFYLQDNKKTGGYLYPDIFINIQLNKARIFFKLTHISAGMAGNTYYMTPHYPMADRAIRFGVSWMFYD